MIYRILFIFILFTSGCKTVQTPSASVYDSSPAVNFNRILQEEVTNSKNGTVGISLTVISPQLGLDFSGAAGYNSLQKDSVLHKDQPFRIASLTKTFVATAILRLQEKGLLLIDDPITKYISQNHRTILEKGGYTPSKITIKQCMLHTSGLFDYAEGNKDYITEAIKTPTKKWTRTEQIQFAMTHGQPYALPGEEYHYSDTGFILLGEIIETVTKMDLAEGLRSLLKFDVLNMTSTWLESLENRPDGLRPSVKRYLDDIDTTFWDNSIDLYGGGGLSSTTRDLSVYLQALFNGGIYENDDTLPIMLLKKDFDSGNRNLPDYRLGLGYTKTKSSKVEVYMHSGFWGTLFVYIPAYKCSIAINHTNGDSQTLKKVGTYIKWLQEQS